MTFKKILLTIIMVGSVSIVKTENKNDDVQINKILKLLDETYRFVYNKHQQGLYREYSDRVLQNTDQAQILFLVDISKNSVKEDEKILAIKALEYLCIKEPELIQETIYFVIKAKAYEYVEPLVKAGANLNAKVTKCYTLKERLEARFGSLKIKKVESHHCNRWKSKLFGLSNECKQIKSSLDLFEQKEKNL